MSHLALVGPEIEENLSLRYLAAALAERGHTTDIVPFNHDSDFSPAVESILLAQPVVVGISLAFQWRAGDFLALAVALRQRGYRGRIDPRPRRARRDRHTPSQRTGFPAGSRQDPLA